MINGTVPERIHCVLRRRTVRRDVADHDRIAVPDKGVLEDHRKFAPSKRSVAFALVQRSDAFLQRKQRLIDFSSIDFGLFALVHVIGTPLVAGQIDEGDFAEVLIFLFECDLQNGMGP